MKIKMLSTFESINNYSALRAEYQPRDYALFVKCNHQPES